ncbi:hypothetical protein HK405_010305, partial [Cladochytrium tenue]
MKSDEHHQHHQRLVLEDGAPQLYSPLSPPLHAPPTAATTLPRRPLVAASIAALAVAACLGLLVALRLPLASPPQHHHRAAAGGASQSSIYGPGAPPLIGLSANERFSDRSVRLPHPDRTGAGVAESTKRNSRRHSRFRCVGDDNRLDAFHERACVFENVCYRPNTGEFLFYRRPGAVPAAVLFDSEAGERLNFTDDGHGFVALHQMVDFEGASMDNTWAPTIVDEVSPASAPESSSGGVVVLERLHAIFSHHSFDDNLGHMLWEEMGGL